MTTPQANESGQGFLEKLAAEMLEDYSDHPEELLIVLPGKRARIFLYQALGRYSGRPVWAPEVLTMEEFVYNTMSLDSADEIALSLELWEVCRETHGFEITFEQFAGWANIILKDFNDVDLFLADPRQVFTNLLQARELQLWTPGDRQQLSEYEQQYIEFYRHLLPWYESFRSRLLAQRKSYQGLAFRLLAEDSGRLRDSTSGRSIIFAGFNAFTPSEERIISILERAGRASLRWDADSWYLNDPLQEAGHFIRRWNKDHPSANFRWRSDNLVADSKKITVYGVNGNRAQARLAGDLLSKVEDPDTSTAVVLPDESLLLPVLNSIPEQITKFNVTMGLPFRHTLALSWLQLNMQLFVRPGSKPSPWVRVAHLLPVIRHPWFRLLMGVEGRANVADTALLNLSRRFYSLEELTEIFTDACPETGGRTEAFFKPVVSPAHFLEMAEQSVRQLLQTPEISGQPFDKGALLEALRVIRLTEGALMAASATNDTRAGFTMLKFIMNRLLTSATVPFTGEPLEGIQVLGLLETRNLDFKNVILLSANERILPSGRRQPTLIPYDIRTAHNLPGVQYQDAIYAYHFYHLIQRAENVHIIYNTDLSSELTGEMSRFVRQIETELVPANPSIAFSHHKVPDKVTGMTNYREISIPKSDAIYDSLKLLLTTRGLSPSQMINYVKCPLMFYFTFIAGLKEPPSFEEALDFRELGTVVHHSLQKIYESVAGTSLNTAGCNPLLLTQEFFPAAMEISDSTVISEMLKHLGGGGAITGKNMIIAEVAQFMVKRFLENEHRLTENHRIEVLNVERPMERSIDIHTDTKTLTVKFKGFIDRIDRFDDLMRITDYKTGKIEEKDLKFSAMEEVFSNPKYDKVLQLLFYSWIFAREEKQYNITTGIFTLKSPASYFISLPAMKDQPENSISSIIDEFEAALVDFCRVLLDRDIPFSQTTDPKICEKCTFYPICLTDSKDTEEE